MQAGMKWCGRSAKGMQCCWHAMRQLQGQSCPPRLAQKQQGKVQQSCLRPSEVIAFNVTIETASQEWNAIIEKA
jgi:hypothetical protein